MLSINAHLTELNLGWNSLMEKGGANCCLLLRNQLNSCVAYLGSEALARAMDENIVCVILNLGWNGIGVNGGMAWGKQLEHNASLKVFKCFWSSPGFRL